MGESGCGKSSAGRAISNLYPPTAGKVVFDGQVIFDVENREYIDKKKMQEMRRDIQMIFQDPFASLDPRMSIGAIVSEGLIKHKIMNKDQALERTKELLEKSVAWTKAMCPSILMSFPAASASGSALHGLWP